MHSDYAKRIYLHPFTQLAIERSRQRRAALESAAARFGDERIPGDVTQLADSGKEREANEAGGSETFRSDAASLLEATGLDSARRTDIDDFVPPIIPPTSRGPPAVFSVSGSSLGMLPPLRSLAAASDRRDSWSPRVFDSTRTGLPTSNMRTHVDSESAGKRLLHAALE